MSEVVIVGSSKDNANLSGIFILDKNTGTSICPQFKNCIVDPNTIALAGKSNSAFGGSSSSGDYIIAAQSKKPILNIWQITKPQIHMQCHLQEILTAIATDPSGIYLYGGSKKGWLYVWDITTGELIKTWHAHFKGISKIVVDSKNQFVVSASEDAMIKVWEIDSILECLSTLKSISGKKSFTSIISWNSHNLPIRDIIVIGSGFGVCRIVSCSLDKTVAIHDVHTSKQCIRLSFPQSLESVTMNSTEDFIFVGSSFGNIYISSMSVSAIALSAATAQVFHSQGEILKNNNSDSQLTVLEGHTKAVTSLSCSLDGVTLVSASEDGSLRFWNIWTKQCIREIKPFNGAPVTVAMIIVKPQALGLGSQKPFLHPFENLAKYVDDSKSQNSSHSVGSSVIGRVSVVRDAHIKLDNPDYIGGNGISFQKDNSQHDSEYISLINLDKCTEVDEIIVDGNLFLTSGLISNKKNRNKDDIKTASAGSNLLLASSDLNMLKREKASVNNDSNPTSLLEFVQQGKKKKNKR